MRVGAEGVELRKSKTTVLEIVWAYLYSGRPDRAWAELEGARPPVYEYLKADPSQQNGGRMMYGAPGVSGPGGPVLVKDEGAPGLYAADKEPKAILLWRPPPTAAEQRVVQGEESVELTIDAAGKVNAVKMLAPGSDPELLQAAKEWRFVPASVDGKPVAYAMKMDVRLVR